MPVLMYHHISPNRGDMITVAPEVFDAQMRHVKEAGYRSLSVDELVGFMRGKNEIDGRAVAITFDDGYLDNYVYAFPVLKACGVKATVFTVTAWADCATKENGAEGKGSLIEEFRRRPPTHAEAKAMIEKGDCRGAVMDWEMIEEMRGSGLVEFHSHTMTHERCDRLSGEGLANELAGSRQALEERLNVACKYLCWPKGKHAPESVEAAKAAGYAGIFTTAPGVARRGDDPFSIKRIPVKDGVNWFKSRLRIYTSPLMSALYLRMSGKR
ncbi:MAG: polysaccharide deacetylase family protein [Deltaproteobacteria bacterium]|nr:polysaccharide deacetylase family protein [Deltaproteobacteria bacterium]